MMNSHITIRNAIFVLVLCLSAWASLSSATALNENCVVSVLNRTVQVKADGTWVLPNIPANFGAVRARTTCVQNGTTVSGQSEFFTIPANGSIDVPQIVLGPATPIPNQITVTANPTTLTQAGQTGQLTVTGKYADNTTQNLTQSATGTQYLISNPDLATISPDGLVTAKQSGTVIVQAINEGTQGLLRLSVALSVDTDGDGILDDIELREGLDPNNPADALDDADRDGLNNKDELQRGTLIHNPDSDGDKVLDGEEVRLGTNPLLGDTDGDGVPDNVEIASGSNPLDPASINLAGALSRIVVAPTSFVINVSTVDLVAFQQLQVTGEFTLGGTINLTSRARGTNYASSNLQVCNFGTPDGRIFGGADGVCTITVTNNGFTATARGTVRTFTPQAKSQLSIPGYANNVDAGGSFAYVAAGATGLQVVSVSDPINPQIVGSEDTPGNANDVRLVGNLVFIADGSFGLRIFDVQDPTNPSLVGFIDTPGDAMDVMVTDGLAYVADGGAGTAIIDLANLSGPALLKQVDTPGTARGIDVLTASNGKRYVIVADDAPSAALRVIDVTDVANATLVASLSLAGSPKDLRVSGNFAYIAAFTGGLRVVDLSNPLAPVASGSLPSQFVPRDVEVAGNFALFAEQLFPNAVPLVEVTDPATPIFRTAIDFSGLGDYAGTGIATNEPYFYMTGENFIVSTDNGSIGNTRLFIGQYLPQDDRNGVAPQVSLISPLDGSSVVQGETISLYANATDDVAVAAVTFKVNGVEVSTDTSAPYETLYTVPTNAMNLTIEAEAIDLGNNLATSSQVNITAISDPLTTVVGRIFDELGNPLAGATVICNNVTTTSNQDGRFMIAGMETVTGPIGCTSSFVDNQGQALSGTSLRVTPARGGETDMGSLALSAAHFETDLGINLNQPDDTFNYIAFTDGFAFPFYGVTYAGVYISSNGRLTFNFGDGTFTENLTDFNEQPQLSAFFDDLYPPSGPIGHGVYVKQFSDRLVVTWNMVAHFSTGGSNTIQAVLFRDGRVQIGYNGISATNTGAIVGISPGNSPAPNETDFSASAPFTVIEPRAIYEWFTGSNDLFDLDARFLIFTPAVSGGYSVNVKPLQ